MEDVHLMRRVYSIFLPVAFSLSLLGCTENTEISNIGAVTSDAGSSLSAMKRFYNVSADDKVIDIINHPAFEGFGRFLFPSEYRMPDDKMRLDGINSLLPYHSNINADTTQVLNYML